MDVMIIIVKGEDRWYKYRYYIDIIIYYIDIML